MLPSLVDGGFHIVCYDDELRRPPVVIAAKAYDVHLSHSGREHSEKTGGEQEGDGLRFRPFILLQGQKW